MSQGNLVSNAPGGEHILHLLGKLAGFVGVVTSLSCLVGLTHLSVMYFWLDCLWVLKLHSVHDFIFEGASSVAVLTGAAGIAFCISEDHKKILLNVSNGLFLLILFAVFTLKFIDVKEVFISQIARHYVFAGIGVNTAGFLLWSMAKRDALVLAIMSLSAFLITGFAVSISYFYFSGVYGPEPILLTNTENNSKGLLVNSFSGRHLLRVCGPEARFMIIEPSENWVSESIEAFDVSEWNSPSCGW